MNRDKAHIIYVVESITMIMALLEQGVTRETYDKDWVVREAILRRLQTLAESASLLSQAVKDYDPSMMWMRIKAFRNALAHGYLGEIDDELVWDTIHYQLEPLQQILQKYYEEHYDN
jgi:uncharacterized protein with HEPN domain